ncbi:MAG TPA: ABC transporter ATP-binding protein [Candidatus Dojkabacteria bacterium]|jgi:ABC-2 type transport system ATP-binding protein|nr:ABC transporter ATP-binding protein [Candidatus Dojkabacteria bacterium]
MEQEPIIQLKNIRKSFFLPHQRHDSLIEFMSNPLRIFKPSGEQFTVLKDIDLDIYPGEFLGIMGRNGSGKSTLLKILAGIYIPTSGSVKVKGKMVPFLELGVGFNPELTGRENVFMNGIILGMPKEFLKKKYDEIVAFAELEKFMDMPLKNYSSGMQVRLAFSIAIMADADIYILDEVLAVGDIAFQKKCFDIFREYKKREKTIILVTHSSSSVRDFCDRAVYLKDGILQVTGSVEEVIKAYEIG